MIRIMSNAYASLLKTLHVKNDGSGNISKGAGSKFGGLNSLKICLGICLVEK
jgi:hypothetical protein